MFKKEITLSKSLEKLQFVAKVYLAIVIVLAGAFCAFVTFQIATGDTEINSFRDLSVVLTPSVINTTNHSSPGLGEFSIVKVGSVNYISIQFNSGIYFLLFKLKSILAFAMAIFVFYQFKKFAFSVDEKNVFSFKSIECLKKISVSLFIAGLCFLLLGMLADLLIPMYLDGVALRLNLNANARMPFRLESMSTIFSFGMIVLGLSLGVISNVFKLGLKLKEENDLTV